MAIKRVLSLGAGWQSTTLALMSIRGELPRVDAWVFADTQYEPAAVYDHLSWLEEQGRAAGIDCHRVTVGNLRQDALDFRQHRRSEDGKRYASLPVFVRNPDGSIGKLQRQCTKEYKVEPCERFLRRHVMGMEPGQRAPRTLQIEQWFGISSDEASRVSYPGRYETSKTKVIKDLFGEPMAIRRKRWRPDPWKSHCYPLLGMTLLANRQVKETPMLPFPMNRDDCGAWLKKHFPGRKVPRSACICCPFRTNDEWRDMRDNDPVSWADAVSFDYELRLRPEAGLTDDRKQKIRNPLVGTIYLHRQCVPLDMVDLDGESERTGGGCGAMYDGCSSGMCGV